MLKAYALYDPEIGYCQGQAFITGLLLMHVRQRHATYASGQVRRAHRGRVATATATANAARVAHEQMPEEEAFASLVRILEDYNLRELYKEGMEGMRVRAYQLNALVQEQLPGLHRHMGECGIQPLMYAAQWFMALYATDFPLAVVLRIVDVMLVEGEDVLMRVALALLRANQEILLKLKFESLLDHLRHHLYTETTFREPSELISEAMRVRLSERRLEKLAEEARAHIADANREKGEMVKLRLERREADARAKAFEAQVMAAGVEHDRLVSELAACKLAHASALERLDEQDRALRQFQRLMVADSDERLSEIGRLHKETKALEQQNYELARELIDVKVRRPATWVSVALRVVVGGGGGAEGGGEGRAHGKGHVRARSSSPSLRSGRRVRGTTALSCGLRRHTAKRRSSPTSWSWSAGVAWP